MPARREVYQDKAAGPGLGKFDALLASREVHEELLLGAVEQERLPNASRPPRPSLIERVQAVLRRG